MTDATNPSPLVGVRTYTSAQVCGGANSGQTPEWVCAIDAARAIEAARAEGRREACAAMEETDKMRAMWEAAAREAHAVQSRLQGEVESLRVEIERVDEDPDLKTEGSTT